MTADPHHPDPAERLELDEVDQLVAELVGEYVERCERHQTPRVDELLAEAAALGPSVAAQFRTIVALYDALASAEDER